MSKPKNPLLHRQSRRGMITGIVVVGLIVLALAAGVTIQYLRTHGEVEATAGGSEPAVLVGPGESGKGVTVGKADAKNTIELYLDFRCPHCKEFEDASESTINQMVDDGKAKVTYYPLAFVDPDVSPRAANGFACAAAAGRASGYADALYANFGQAWTDGQLVDLGTKLGITDSSFSECVTSDKYTQWLQSVDAAAGARGVTGTPTVFVNGKQLPTDQLTPEGIQAAASL
jgi:protein-disulfide isomerase